jgi:hypothetical protein
MAVRRTTLVTLAPGADAGAVARALEQQSGWARPTLPGVVRGGDVVWRVTGEDQDAAILDRLPVAGFTSATYQDGPTGTRDVAGSAAVHRSLLLRVEADAAITAAFEAELFAMGEHIPVMREWRLSRVTASQGPTAWTHVWEQVFPDLRALEHAYLRHPYHWGHVDRWFDGEAPQRIVRPGFCHTFCLLDDSKTSVGNPASASAPKWST